MTAEQTTVLLILLVTVVLFLWGRWRHDMVALAALLACVLAGLVPPEDAFMGFGHPAVITVACVLVLSRGLQQSGAIDVLARRLLPAEAGVTLSIVALTALGAALSAFMNNVGALALLMPVAIQIARRQQLAPGVVLMPLAFGTILGGMTTLIGTPPNLIVSGFRAANGTGGFAMFDFAPVGLAVACTGVLFVTLLGWRLVPRRKPSGMEGFDSAAYITEARVPEEAKAVGLSLREVEAELEQAGAQVLALVRNEVRVTAPSLRRRVQARDILLIEAEAESLSNVLSSLGLKLAAEKANSDKDGVAADAEDQSAESSEDKAAREKGEEPVLMEFVVLPDSELIGRSAREIRLRSRYNINLLALSRQGQRSVARLRAFAFTAGDLLLMQGSPEALGEFATTAGCVPLAERELRIPDKRKLVQACAIMAGTILCVTLGLLPAAIAFSAGVLASMAAGTVPPRSVYSAIDGSVVVLLGALFPVAAAMETTGAAGLVARFLLEQLVQGHEVLALALILVVTMTLSDLMNNAATAAVMCPIALGTAAQLGANADPFLMAVAIGGSCAFLTPIGHQNNTLILGPGGFRFGDYWRLGLPLEIVVVLIGIPMLLLVWPL
ncbi:SLC13 family permease [Zobellella denitrificans]|uniref:SLC13 family permease n=1 Tax=Zobellella denitrificans TaxID=347534 RepID=UPI000B8C3EBA|nr:SLC13 family permease [Zobellella denitrificans]OXS14103.1 SLC13 family permease [Zobellella denitrificans]